MIAPISSAHIASPQSGLTATTPDVKALKAAESFNSFVVEKMLNINTDLKHSAADKSEASKHIEHMFNATMAQQIAENNPALNNKIAKEMLK